MRVESPPGMWKADSGTQISTRLGSINTWQGNSGGLTIIGGTAASDDLKLRGSSSLTAPWGQILVQDHLTNVGANSFFAVVNAPSLIFDNVLSNYIGFGVGTGATWQVNTAVGGAFGLGQAGLVYNPTIKNDASVAISDLGAQAVFGNVSTTQADGATCTASFVQSYVHSPTYNVINAGVLTITTERAFTSQPTIGASATITDRAGFYFRNKQSTGTQTNAVALDVEDQTVGTLAAAVRSAIAAGTGKYFLRDTGGAQSVFTGKVMFGGVAAPTNAISLDGEAARTIWMEREATANTAGNALTVQAGGATSGATDKPGGALTFIPGMSTGKGTAIIRMQGLTMSTGSLTTDNTVIDRQIISGFRALSDNATITIANLTIANNTAIGGLLRYAVEAYSPGEMQVETGMVSYSSRNRAGTIVSNTPTKFGNQQSLSAGSLTVTFQLSSANPAELYLNANTSLAVSDTGFPRITYSLDNLTQQAVAVITGT